MTVREFADKHGCRIYCMPDGDREIKGGYAGDLLSWVMGRLRSDRAWVTIMSNLNIVAVASLADPSCIILSEGVVPETDVIAKAIENGVNILGMAQDTFSVCLTVASSL
ncbi:MAG: hypothetical protein IKA76_03970 [Clostridia bacterium]|nr:hypothetical protein [Clostridia bacterium]